MRSSIIAAAFAAGAIAVPFQNKQKRDMVTVTDVEMAYKTVVVTVTAGANPTPDVQNKHGEHRHHNYHQYPPVQKPPTQDLPAQDPPAQNPPAPNPPKPQPPPSPTNDAPAPSPPSGGGNGGNGGDSGNGGGSGDGGDGGNGGGCGASSAGSSYAEIATFHHNVHRCNHSAPAIAWDAGLQKSASDIAATCIYEHNVKMDGGGYGQNIAAGVEPNNISAIITNLFYNGEVNYYEGLYGQSNPSMANFEQWGHFSQLVWKGTTHFACATQDCSGKGLANVGGDVAPYFTVCNYKSPGNFGGEYGANVGEPLGHPTANWNTGL